jgi:hypothetical protein
LAIEADALSFEAAALEEGSADESLGAVYNSGVKK